VLCVFTKFTTNHSKDIGLGLFISKKIIEAHGGKIWAGETKVDCAFFFDQQADENQPQGA
jgi:signal transduction histidine kinase